MTARQGLPIVPVPGGGLAETLGHAVYPVLMAREGFEQ
ncbi:hypothetical protein TVNIR_0322 [Thioalkalivibrio nitratireducens DSM 14787]|uniref:Uncharacterized protein n=1 Tax=Thioalkalivibrio nitratireducens (strain DSM 14787 / UNIQEM 213 / ALEN2) TaxID=1255043 RepID=L0DUK7_THIND|nr:hypothetical protein TVNIR_0322 [Thioalkalivibrio nitratireducens DSM 14787]